MMRAMIQLDNIALTFSGDRKNLGSIDFGSVIVTAMGPHYFPLGELENFGVYRGGNDFSDIRVSENKIDGWTRSNDMWIRCVAEKIAKRVQIKTMFENRDSQKPFAFVFFVRAESIELLGKKYHRGSLHRFQGVGSMVDLIGVNERVRIVASSKGAMQIIPLAGDDSFWGAYFLVAFEIGAEDSQKVFDFEKIVLYDQQ